MQVNVNFTLWPIYLQGRSPWYPSHRNPRSNADTVVKRKICDFPRESNPDCPVFHPVVYSSGVQLRPYHAPFCRDQKYDVSLSQVY
jgi:hypothetical protein